jgi:hypothetical protein
MEPETTGSHHNDERIVNLLLSSSHLHHPHGFIFQLAAGCGKTTILRSMMELLTKSTSQSAFPSSPSSSQASYYDCVGAIREQRYGTHVLLDSCCDSYTQSNFSRLSALHYFRKWLEKELSSGKRIFMLDNIDGDTAASKHRDSYDNLAFKAGLASIIDHCCSSSVDNSIKFVCSCTSVNNVPPSLMQPYRLGSPLLLEPPTHADRRLLVQKMLSSLVSADELLNDRRAFDVVNLIASRTQVLCAN